MSASLSKRSMMMFATAPTSSLASVLIDRYGDCRISAAAALRDLERIETRFVAGPVPIERPNTMMRCGGIRSFCVRKLNAARVWRFTPPSHGFPGTGP